MKQAALEAISRAREIDAGRPPRYTKWIPHTPFAKQQRFLSLTDLEAGYGGSAGGAKTDALLMDALANVDVPGYSALLVRKTFTDLTQPGALIPRSHQWLAGTGAKWRERERIWVFPSGATLKFGYLENEYDHLQYQGSEFQYIGFDELTQHREDQYLYLFSRLRRKTQIKVPLKMRSTTNPGGPGHDWVRKRFIEGATEDEKDVLVLSGKTEDREFTRTFIKAYLWDNPFIGREEYEANLQHLDPVTRAQLLEGDWDISPSGEHFRLEWFDKAYVDRVPILESYMRAWDPSLTKGGDPSASTLMGSFDRDVFLLDQTEDWNDVPGLIELIVRKSKTDPPGTAIAVEDSSISKPIIWSLRQRAELQDVRILSVPVTKITGPRVGNDKLSRASAWINRLADGELKIVRGEWNARFVSQCLRFTNQKTDKDDLIDSVSVGYSQVFKHRGRTRNVKQEVQVGSPRWYLDEIKRRGNAGRNGGYYPTR